jgi:high-affinity iron transporter
MLSLAIIVFREVLEISLILGVVFAATRGLERRGPWIAGGFAAGVVGSAVVAACAGAISSAVSGVGQELFDAAVLFTAATLITWCVVWMKRHAMHLSQRLRDLGRSVVEGRTPHYVLAVVVAATMLREGSEIVMMTYGVILTGLSIASVATGALLGLGVGSLIGAGLYLGLVRLSVRHVFGATGFLLVFLAAGMVAQATAKLMAAGWIPFLSTPVWDTSRVLSESGLIGGALHTLVGYSAQPTGVEVASYCAAVITIVALLRLYGRVAPSARKVSS